MNSLILTDADVAGGRRDVAAALTAGHQSLTERKPARAHRPAADHTATLARRLERLARQALPQSLRHLRRDPTEIWLLAHDPKRAEDIDAKRIGIGMAQFDPNCPADVARVARNNAMRERRRKTAAGTAAVIGSAAAIGEAELSGRDLDHAAPDDLAEAGETLTAMQAAGLIDAEWRRTVAEPATCGDPVDDAPALSATAAADRCGRSVRTVQTHMCALGDAERAGQLVLPCVPPVAEVYAARPRDVEVTP